jgi:hypothetical protein
MTMLSDVSIDTNDYRQSPLQMRRLTILPTVAAPQGRYRPTKNDIFIQFHNSLGQWRNETASMSLVRDKIEHVAFKRIVNLGTVAGPWILKEIRHRPDLLVMALPLIYKNENSLPVTARGKVKEIVNAWLNWANRQNIDVY